jgi:16S rRNA processing protein RimM
MASSLKSAAKPDPSILIGRILRPHGVLGEMRVEPLTDFPERFEGLERVYVDLPNGGRWFTIDGVRAGKDGVILLGFEGVTTPEDVDKLRNGKLILPRAEAVPLPEDVYYIDDLKGLKTYDEAGTFLGKIREVYASAQDVLEIRTTDGKDVMVPLVKQWVPVVDIAGDRVVIANWTALAPEETVDADGPEKPAKPKKRYADRKKKKLAAADGSAPPADPPPAT